jgi:hypothetical protein
MLPLMHKVIFVGALHATPLRIWLSAAILLAFTIVACSGDDKSDSPSTSPSESTGAAGAIGDPALPVACPAPAAVCGLALEFLPAVQRKDAGAITARMVTQSLVCPVTLPSDSSDPALDALAGVCSAKPLQDTVAVYEFNNGKGPFYFGDLEIFKQQVAIAFAATLPGNDSGSIYAVGCGKPNRDLPPDCDRHAAVVYRSDSGLHLGLVLLHTESGWQVEKLWTPFPGLIPLGETGATVELTTLSEVKVLDLVLYEP